MEHGLEEEVTGLLLAWREGDGDALVALMPLVYQHLKGIAEHLMRAERPGHSLNTTGLVHEAYFRLAALDRIRWQDRAHFYAMSARVMRRVLVDHARHLSREKRGGDAVTISLDDLNDSTSPIAPELLALEEALGQLRREDPQRAEIVELRFFGGLERKEIAEVMGLSPATVTRRWRSARAWLVDYLDENVSA
jgi:RNA polymerase sigma factor (TIGR02999 family)